MERGGGSGAEGRRSGWRPPPFLLVSTALLALLLVAIAVPGLARYGSGADAAASTTPAHPGEVASTPSAGPAYPGVARPGSAAGLPADPSSGTAVGPILATAGFHPGARTPADPEEGAAFLAPRAVSRSSATPAARRRLAAALAGALRHSRLRGLGVHVREVGGGEVLARRADDLFVLASNTKLFTTVAALDTFGPGHLLETRLLVRGDVGGDGALHGDLAVVGGGDPTLSWRLSADGDPLRLFEGWAQALRRRGVRRVEGDLFLDHGRFRAPLTHPQWDPDKALKWYQAPVAALSFHENVVKVRAVPGERAGEPARLGAEPDLPEFPVHGSVRTAGTWRGNHLLIRSEGGGALAVHGGVYHRVDEVVRPVAVDDPVAFFGAALLHTLEGEGVAVDGRPRPRASLPGLAWETAAVHRTPLLDVLETTNHESQNLFAESLVKLVGAERCGAGSWERGVRAVEEVAAALGVDPAGLHLADGSGLSRANRAAPRQVTAFLAAMTEHPHAAAWVATLPAGAEVATSLEERFDEAAYRGRVRAKTGTLSAVSTLSGYARGRSGRLYAFSVLTEGVVAHGRRVQDRLVRALADHG